MDEYSTPNTGSPSSNPWTLDTTPGLKDNNKSVKPREVLDAKEEMFVTSSPPLDARKSWADDRTHGVST
ncbi:hypothetical protein K0M31_005724 [Melipona bicolor]|uniref:Uncharacterized protein n=1 Tax=Melipona bicolor TaxID=60889 RepID=A0AA40KM62_9HYME|nr:hypothetical protein K0M31_005724 [Melipona bicolor]